MDNVDISAWVAAAGEDRLQRPFREAVHITLHAIASSAELQPRMLMKGGILMAIRYDTGRFTKDIDFSTTTHYRDFAPEEQNFLDRLQAALEEASATLGYQLDCRLQSNEVQPSAEGNYQTLRMKIGYAYVGTREHERLSAGMAVSRVVQVDYSFNELVHDIDFIEIQENAELQTYGELTLIAEKYRALLQQLSRGRTRAQDIYDLHFALTKFPITDEDKKARLLASLKEKALSRDLVVTRDTFNNKELRDLTREKYYAELQAQVADPLPDYDEAFDVVKAFYDGLPW